MTYLFLIITVICSSLSNIFAKQYDIKAKYKNTYLYVAVMQIFAMMFFIVTSAGSFSPKPGLIGYSVAFSLFFTMAIVGNNQAIKYGSLAVSSLIVQCSLLLPTLYGIIFLKDNIGVYGYMGIMLLLISLFMVNKTEKNIKVSSKWLFWIIAAFIGNGMCSIVQKIQQTVFDGACKNEFMIVALGIGAVFMSCTAMIKSKNLKRELCDAIKIAPFSGVANGSVNLLVMVLTALLPTAVLFPVISSGGMVMTFIFSVTLFKEKLTKRQYAGYLLGVISIILINL